MKPNELAQAIASALYNKKGEDIVTIDVKHLTSITDYFVIATGRNVIQVRALAEDVEEKLHAMGVDARRKEGYQAGRWIVLDYSSVIVHIFHPEERDFYNIERLWMDGQNSVRYEPEEEKA